MSTIKSPMLSAQVSTEGLNNLQYPVWVSRKIDGIRCLLHPDLGPVTRSFKPIPNVFVRQELQLLPPFLDGELVAIDTPLDPGVMGEPLSFNETQSAIMTQGGKPRFMYYVFDHFEGPDDPFRVRLERVFSMTKYLSGVAPVEGVYHRPAYSAEGVLALWQEAVEAGFEGVMIRAMDGPYKSGRSTLKQGWLIKYKEMADAEGIVVGFQELLHNDNPDLKDIFGHAKRSSHKENKVPAGTLGALILNTQWGELNVGTGFDASLRDHIWAHRQKYLGKVVTFKYQTPGMQDLPRFPVFMYFRED